MKFYQSKLLNKLPELTHAFTTKHSGKSIFPYDTCNLAFHVGDNPLNVEKNHELLAKALGYEKRTLVHMKQIHSDIIKIVGENDHFYAPPTCDALITNKKNIPLMVMVADCSPLLFYDPVQKVIAVAHAGRAGAFANITHKVISIFEEKFASNAADILVAVGPNIAACCYEVGDEIFDEAKERGLEYALERKGGRYYLDINAILKTQLQNAGIEEKNREFSPTCTCCAHEEYFSYRASGVTGRFSGVLMLA
ncbi:MAG: peptidoglycan editing factor PgeF [Sulfurimonas sp.]|nr:peptidoglycan editing factor PgeF [Sulfurimonas sp.]